LNSAVIWVSPLPSTTRKIRMSSDTVVDVSPISPSNESQNVGLSIEDGGEGSVVYYRAWIPPSGIDGWGVVNKVQVTKKGNWTFLNAIHIRVIWILETIIPSNTSYGRLFQIMWIRSVPCFIWRFRGGGGTISIVTTCESTHLPRLFLTWWEIISWLVS
jgi:hypothetical protein